jgi:hypothetical protein
MANTRLAFLSDDRWIELPAELDAAGAGGCQAGFDPIAG